MSHSLSLPLDKLLAQVNTEGLAYSILNTSTQAMPTIRGLGSLSHAGSEQISFLSNPRMFNLLLETKAGAVILPQQGVDKLPATVPFVVVVCEDPYLLYARISQYFDDSRIDLVPKVIHPTAVIDATAEIAEGVAIGPYVVIEEGVKIGSGSVIGAHCVIGKNSSIGKDTRLHPHVTLYRGTQIGDRCLLHSHATLGADGFGFAPDNTVEKGAWCRIAQFGNVIVGNDVEIGVCTSIDRGALGDTIIGNGVKLDNQIMIGHNCVIGDHTAMAACVGVAGSSIIGKRCTLAGAAMLAGHLELADDVHISGATGVMSSINKPGRYTSAYPIEEHSEWQKNAAVIKNLYKLRRRVQELEKKL
ncbi:MULTISPECIES: UDP-3-O-(3-hydroxymyristoyl)glucosamine N-acyltransferase [Oligella]|uniref:UDP-3-O-acylglucosamine N-acyltransferase n=1 Tax=Oligella urethralis DNF00040 TaxID=1401065 RepID=A0A095Z5K7_9BURK|nr:MULTISPECIES: UDP-3-O-(3-hydroxymyristoyl)glucosamine N-acyltransferase [Oligella]AVL70990.1 UDP-3-O-(3-hydroxymyristoyl)glucosamine N-acyltransferase [Oligella urethralis]KGF30010.1 UDP-N-acetylglucosamine acyltransferase [Oligella urethralis DNF00040]OFS84641.1 UDP-3-O-(3-hydroxymyristoyl)glucosamine N-acyltransferase [Oligella sp. HMSC05A10]OFV47913.1 UDP-3-O-(3-hydroxymyristoyl)glucosamine N-acyltransferase [Oligella sp. HMSC09E12]WOS37507.1 UDP-3-O-acylglucosamine N-acyltransferase [Ol